MTAFFDRVKFLPAAGGTADFTVDSAVTGFRTPAQASVPNGAIVSYSAESPDHSEWEVGIGTYATSGTVLARTTVIASSTGSKIDFAAAPRVAISPLAHDFAAPLGVVVRAATTANVTIASALNSGDTIDGVTLATGDLVLVRLQTSTAENGIYVVAASPARAPRYRTYDSHPGMIVSVSEGSTLGGSKWRCTSAKGGTLGSTALTFAELYTSSTITNASSVSGGSISAALNTLLAALPAAASDTVAGLIEIATQAEMEAATDTGRAVVPARVKHDPGVAKAWALVNVSGGTPSLAAGYNITSIADPGVGLLTINFDADFSSANWAGAMVPTDNVQNIVQRFTSKAAGSASCACVTIAATPALVDPVAWNFVGYGDL